MDVPDLLNEPLSGTYDLDAVDAAVAEVRGFCRWHIAPSVEEAMIVDGSGTPTLLLRSVRITAIASVVEDGILLAFGKDYTWSESGILERTWGLWTSKRRGVVVTLTHGYDSCPVEITRIVARLATGGLTAGLDQSTGARIRTSTEGPYAVGYDPDSGAGEIDVYAARVLSRYQVPDL